MRVEKTDDYRDWIDGLKDLSGRARILMRVEEHEVGRKQRAFGQEADEHRRLAAIGQRGMVERGIDRVLVGVGQELAAPEHQGPRARIGSRCVIGAQGDGRLDHIFQRSLPFGLEAADHLAHRRTADVQPVGGPSERRLVDRAPCRQ